MMANLLLLRLVVGSEHELPFCTVLPSVKVQLSVRLFSQ